MFYCMFYFACDRSLSGRDLVTRFQCRSTQPASGQAQQNLN